MPILAIVVDIPAIKGKAPQMPQPIKPKKIIYKILFLKIFFFFEISEYKNGDRIKKTKSHLQNASEMGGTYSTPPRATIILEAIKIGWINKSKYG